MRLSAFILLAGSLALTIGCSKKTDTPGGPGSATADNLEGVWIVEDFDDGDPKGGAREFFKTMKIAIKGDKIYLFESAEDYMPAQLITFDATQNPKHITITSTDDKGAPRSDGARPGIYKLEGDKLTVARAEEKGGARPKDFSVVPAKVPGQGPPVVSVMKLTKSKDPVPEFKAKDFSAPIKRSDLTPIPPLPTPTPTPPPSTPELPKLPTPPPGGAGDLPKLPGVDLPKLPGVDLPKLPTPPEPK